MDYVDYEQYSNAIINIHTSCIDRSINTYNIGQN